MTLGLLALVLGWLSTDDVLSCVVRAKHETSFSRETKMTERLQLVIQDFGETDFDSFSNALRDIQVLRHSSFWHCCNMYMVAGGI